MVEAFPSFQLRGAKEEELRLFLFQTEAQGRIHAQVLEETFGFCKLLIDRPFFRVIEIGVGTSSTPVWLSLIEKDGLVLGIDCDPRPYDWIKDPPILLICHALFLSMGGLWIKKL